MSAGAVKQVKHCGACGQDLELEAFALNRARYDGRQGQCRGCAAEFQRLRHRKPPEPSYELRRAHPMDSGTSKLLVSAQRRLRMLELGMVRCVLPALIPTDLRQVALATRLPCSSLIFGGRELAHCQDIHGLSEVPAGAFEARVEERVAA